MSTLSINLLPTELKLKSRGPDKLKIAQNIGISVLLILVFMASTTVALRILQSKNIANLSSQVKSGEDKILQLKSKEASLAILKNRVTVINQIIEKNPNNAILYQRISDLIPEDILVSAYSIDHEANVSFSALVPSRVSLSFLFDSLNPVQQGFKKVSIESLSKNKDGSYRANVVIQTK